MITPEQKKMIFNHLMNKNLPLDLKLEIVDHMNEQIEHKMDVEKRSFEDAFAEVKNDWYEDLDMHLRFIFQNMTNFQWKILKQAQRTILKKSLFITLGFMLINFLFIKKYCPFVFRFDFIFFSLLVVIGFYFIIFNYKILKTTSRSEKRRISYVQRKANLLLIAPFYILLFLLFNFTEKFEKMHFRMVELLNLHHFDLNNLVILFMYFFWVLFWFLGFYYFLAYKKTIEQLKQKIDFKL